MINQTKVSIEKNQKVNRLQRQVAKEQKQPKTSTYAQKQSKRARNEKKYRVKKEIKERTGESTQTTAKFKNKQKKRDIESRENRISNILYV